MHDPLASQGLRLRKTPQPGLPCNFLLSVIPFAITEPVILTVFLVA